MVEENKEVKIEKKMRSKKYLNLLKRELGLILPASL